MIIPAMNRRLFNQMHEDMHSPPPTDILTQTPPFMSLPLLLLPFLMESRGIASGKFCDLMR